jgi:hypothetical protein
MPVNNKLTTSGQAANVPGAVQPLPDPAEFLQHLKEQARLAWRPLLESWMHEELQALLGAKWW